MPTWTDRTSNRNDREWSTIWQIQLSPEDHSTTGVYIMENTPQYQPMSFGGKNMKRPREKGGKCGRKGKEKGRMGERKLEKRKQKGKINAK
jgi:hypothetical protein